MATRIPHIPRPAQQGLATLAVYEREKLLTRAKQMAPAFEQAVHGLRGLPHVIDVRNYGLVAGIELDPIAGSPGARAFGVYLKCFERGLLIRTTGDIIALSPALVIEPKHIDELIGNPLSRPQGIMGTFPVSWQIRNVPIYCGTPAAAGALAGINFLANSLRTSA
jgi:hypothetical protein